MHEVEHKYMIELEVVPDHGILYFIPCLQYSVQHKWRNECSEHTVYYNPVLKDFALAEDRKEGMVVG